MIVFRGGDGKPRATRGAGIVIHVIRSVVVDTGQPTERARSCGFQVRVILL